MGDVHHALELTLKSPIPLHAGAVRYLMEFTYVENRLDLILGAVLAALLYYAGLIISIHAVKFSELLVSIGHQNMIAALVLAMVVLVILGMGIPPTAVYVLGGSIIVPALGGAISLSQPHPLGRRKGGPYVEPRS